MLTTITATLAAVTGGIIATTCFVASVRGLIIAIAELAHALRLAGFRHDPPLPPDPLAGSLGMGNVQQRRGRRLILIAILVAVLIAWPGVAQ